MSKLLVENGSKSLKNLSCFTVYDEVLVYTVDFGVDGKWKKCPI